MKAFWYAADPDEYYDYEAQVNKCVRLGEYINITFRAKEDDAPVEGQISIKAIAGEQAAAGSWRYHTPRKEMPRFSGSAKPGGGSLIKATVIGQLKNFRGKKVAFEGTWKDENGPEWDFELDAEIEPT